MEIIFKVQKTASTEVVEWQVIDWLAVICLFVHVHHHCLKQIKSNSLDQVNFTWEASESIWFDKHIPRPGSRTPLPSMPWVYLLMPLGLARFDTFRVFWMGTTRPEEFPRNENADASFSAQWCESPWNTTYNIVQVSISNHARTIPTIALEF